MPSNRRSNDGTGKPLPQNPAGASGDGDHGNGLAPCGTDAAYHRHKAHGEAPCEDCLNAHADRLRPYNKAYKRALGQLREMYPVSFQRLLEKELEVLDPYGIKSAQ